MVHVLNIIVGLSYWLYSGQSIIGITYMLIYLFGLISVYFFCKKKICLAIFSHFFVIYGILLLVTQYLFIDNTPSGYFVHIDASGSFYENAVINAGPTKWKDLLASTIFSTYFGEYPLFSLWINSWKLIGLDLGVTNLRLFLRIQDLFFSTGILVILACFFSEIHFSLKKIKRYCYVFGFFSYLFLTSVVFSRDLHVAFFYTLASYYCISPLHHKMEYLKLIIIFAICLGLRPESGLFAIVFPVYYRFRNIKPSVKLLLCGIIFIGIIIGTGILSIFLDAMESYNERALEVSSGGLSNVFFSLPFPLKQFFFVIYSILMPFPFTFYLAQEQVSWLGIPSIGMPFINIISIGTIFLYLRKHKSDYPILYFFILCMSCLILCCIVDPNVRRSFSIIPSIFMLFGLVKTKVPKTRYNNLIILASSFILILNLPALIFLFMKGKI